MSTTNPLGLSDYDLWERQITDLLIEALEISNGDAQGLVEARAFEMSQCWGKGMTPEQTANRIESL